MFPLAPAVTPPPPGEVASTDVRGSPGPRGHAVTMPAPPPPVDAPPTVAYTDGSCLGNPGPGGWAWAVDGGPSDSGSDPHTTNQRMEVLAVIRALEALSGPVHVVSDSTYVVNCFRQRWYEGWKLRGWKNSQGKPVANRDLWETLFALALDPGRRVTFEWVKGHSGDRMNDVVDALATGAAARQEPSGPPPDTGLGQGRLLP